MSDTQRRSVQRRRKEVFPSGGVRHMFQEAAFDVRRDDRLGIDVARESESSRYLQSLQNFLLPLVRDENRPRQQIRR
jgi:hypothetical protein